MAYPAPRGPGALPLAPARTIIDFNGPDRATVAAAGCVLVRSGSGTATAADSVPAAPADVQLRISANVTGDFGNVTGVGPVLGCASLIVGMGLV